ncbi:zinc phosphodiesterase [Reticulomyxa filosa]|uniref:Zinc phosphodiesterase n=1 Tax=Reticulomyxa filosa TaxID=46433 RepID=X6P107_RETFI|nr:zinc phosphodiesterase [Reticulomyxa filosa]|eukprot:ETO32255.1 zinc phosphodiesterase [Reticulomyxa filosa]
MIDCGEGTQHQIKCSQLKSSKLHSIFITHLHGDHCYGIFGLLHMLKAGNRTNPLHVYGPIGIQSLITNALYASGGWNGFEIIIHELGVHGTKYEQDTILNYCTTSETKPPSTSPSQSYHQTSFQVILNPQNKCQFRYKPNQIISLGEIDFGISAFACPITHRVETFGYVFIEKDKEGILNAAKATALGAKGPQMGMLKRGIDVTLKNGTTIYSKDVVGDNIRGKKIAVMQDCSYIDSAFEIAKDCDVLIHECTYDQSHYDNAITFGHSTASMAATHALNLKAKFCCSHNFPGFFFFLHITQKIY